MLSHKKIILELEQAIEEIKNAQGPLTFKFRFKGIGEAFRRLLNIASYLTNSSEYWRYIYSNSTVDDEGEDYADLLNADIGSLAIETGVKLSNEITYDEVVLLDNEKAALLAKATELADNIKYALAKTIKEALFPLTLDLQDNAIDNALATEIASAIKVAHAPITLDLSCNKIGDEGAISLADAIKETKVPLVLFLFWNPLIGDAGNLALDEAKSDNFIIEARRDPLKFLSLIGNTLCSNILTQIYSKTPKPLAQLEIQKALITVARVGALVDIIQQYSIEEEDGFLAWIVVTGIKKVENASPDNKYFNIKYELLNAAYTPSQPRQGIKRKQPPSSKALQLGEKADPKSGRKVDLKRLRLENEVAFNEDGNADGGGTIQAFSSSSSSSPSSTALAKAEIDVYQSHNASTVEDMDVSSSSSSNSASSSGSSASSLPPGGGANEATDIDNQETTNYLSDNVQHANYNLNQALELNSDNREASTDPVLKIWFAWIQDLSKELQQQVLSSFSVQQVLKFLGNTLNPDQFIKDQLNFKVTQEKFELDLYGNYTSSSQEYAKSSIDMPISLGEYTSEALRGGILIDLDPLQKSNFHLDAHSFVDAWQIGSLF